MRILTNSRDGMATTNYYDGMFQRLIGSDEPPSVAVERVATAYLDGKPLPVGKKKLTKKARASLFWSSDVVKNCPPDAWNAEALVLALARYQGQEPVAAEGLATRVAHEAPDALVRAVRYSGLVLNQHSARRTELERATAGNAAVAELCQVLGILDRAYRERVATMEMQKVRLADLSAFDLLIYASLYAFELLVPRADTAAADLTAPSKDAAV